MKLAKKIALGIGLVILLVCFIFYFWMNHMDQKYGQRRQDIEDCRMHKGPNQMCFVNSDGSVSIRDKFKVH